MKISSAVAWIVGSLLVIPGATFKAYEVFFSRPKPLPHYVCRLITTGPQREALSSSYLAELMGLSADHPIVLSQFDRSRAEERIRSSAIIKEAIVKVIKPDTVYVDYTVRQPIALLHDFENTAIDEEGVTFPVAPFFFPKKLPEIYLGISGIRWGELLLGYRMELAQKLLKTIANYSLPIRRLDVSNAFASSLGKREIVVILEENGFSKFLRLTPKNFGQELGNYLELNRNLALESQVIDLRIPQLAFIETNQRN
jgi:cell division septal protein FtsQ